MEGAATSTLATIWAGLALQMAAGAAVNMEAAEAPATTALRMSASQLLGCATPQFLHLPTATRPA